MRAGTRKPKSSRSSLPLPAKTSQMFDKPSYSSSPTQQQQAEQAHHTKSEADGGFNFGRVPILSPTAAAIQPKLTIGQPNDKYEQEADRVADRVMRMPDSAALGSASVEGHSGTGAIQHTCAACSQEYSTAAQENRPAVPENLCPQCRMQAKPLAGPITPLIQRQTDNVLEEDDEEKTALQTKSLVQRQIEGVEEEEEDEQTLQTSAAPGQAPAVTPGVASGINAMRGGGQPLSPATRGFMEPRFGHDFSQVRVHADGNAARTSKQINAQAFTVGQNIAFGAGQYQPNSSSGRMLLAHELTHVVQQRKMKTMAHSSTTRVKEKSETKIQGSLFNIGDKIRIARLRRRLSPLKTKIQRGAMLYLSDSAWKKLTNNTRRLLKVLPFPVPAILRRAILSLLSERGAVHVASVLVLGGVLAALIAALEVLLIIMLAIVVLILILLIIEKIIEAIEESVRRGSACDIQIVNCLNNPWQPDWNRDFGRRKDCGACYRECKHAGGVWPYYKCPS